MEITTDTLQSLAAGASGGVPLTLILLSSMKSLRDSFDGIRDNFEKISRRLEKLELAFEVNYQKDVQLLTEANARLEARVTKIEESFTRRIPG